MTPVYNEISKTIKDNGGRIYFSVVGESCDLGCNAFHMLDLFVFLAIRRLRALIPTELTVIFWKAKEVVM